MSQVNTVLGSIDGSRLGRTLMHEHIFVLSPEIEKTADEWDEAAQQARAVSKLRELKAHGIDTLVDLTVVGLGRSIPRVAAIAAEVPEINVVAATGVYTYNEVPMYFHFRGPGTILGGPEPMVDLFVREIEEGIGETGVRAGILKCASDRPGITPGVERVLRAVARAHRSTGVPITTHTPTPPEPWGLEQQRIFREEGVDLARVVIGHSGGTVNTAYHLELIENGSYLGFDHFGLPGITLEDRVDAVARLCTARLRRSHCALPRRHVLRGLVPPLDHGCIAALAVDVHLRGGAACHARTRDQRRRRQADAGRQPAPDLGGGACLLMRSPALG